MTDSVITKEGRAGGSPVSPFPQSMQPRPFTVYADGAARHHTVCRYDETLVFRLPLHAELEITGGVMRLFRDDDSAVLWLPMTCTGTRDGLQYWECRIPADSICADGEDSGLFYFRFEFDTRYGRLLYAKAPDMVTPVYQWEDIDVHAFQWTVTSPGTQTQIPQTADIMYHIFVDRFSKGEGIPHSEIPHRDDAVYNGDWYNGIPQHAKRPGGKVENNELFGGTLWGVIEKLPYLQSLGVTVLYLSPIFRAYSNHKYDTGDYEHVDPSFGGDEAFSALLTEAKKSGIRIICDGVFNHTGDDSRYFNRYGKYPGVGAYQSEDSPYFDWYRFRRYPDEYDCWWGVKVLPALHSDHPGFRRYICGENGILHKWMSLGVSGWRLDVADELSDAFLYDLHTRVKNENPDAVIYGEVWEDASNKIAYDHRRRYFRGKQLDSVMNYPFRDAIPALIRDGDTLPLARALEMVEAHYPDPVKHLLMNLLGTHDTERILTVLAAKPCGDLDNDALAEIRMTDDEKARGRSLVILAATLQFTLPGIPCIYYGDEIGMEGYRDPFNRRPYPWGKEDPVLLAHYRRLAEIRRTHTVFASGETELRYAQNGVFDFIRRNGNSTLRICVNRSSAPYPIAGCYTELLTETLHHGCMWVPTDGCVILQSAVGTVKTI